MFRKWFIALVMALTMLFTLMAPAFTFAVGEGDPDPDQTTHSETGEQLPGDGAGEGGEGDADKGGDQGNGDANVGAGDQGNGDANVGDGETLSPATVPGDSDGDGDKEEPPSREAPANRSTLSEGWYLIGINGWTVDDLNGADRFVPDENTGLCTLTRNLNENAEFKAVYVHVDSEGNASLDTNSWFPNENVKPGPAGTYYIYFHDVPDKFLRAKSDNLQDGHYYYVGSDVDWERTRAVELESDRSITRTFVTENAFKVFYCHDHGLLDWYGDSSGNNVSVGAGTYIICLEDSVVTATPVYTLTTAVSPDGSGTLVASKTAAVEDEQITLTITPAEGYRFDKLVMNDADLSASLDENNQTIITMPGADATVTAYFAAIEYDVVVDNDNITHGSVLTFVEKATIGQEVTLKVTPEEGYQVSEVKYNDTVIVPVGGEYSFTMPAENVTITATFSKASITHDIELTVGNTWSSSAVNINTDAGYIVESTDSSIVSVAESDNYYVVSALAVGNADVLVYTSSNGEKDQLFVQIHVTVYARVEEEDIDWATVLGPDGNLATAELLNSTPNYISVKLLINGALFPSVTSALDENETVRSAIVNLKVDQLISWACSNNLPITLQVLGTTETEAEALELSATASADIQLVNLKYDDRYDVSALGDLLASYTAGITSKQVGTDTLDTDVAIIVDGKLIATGIGTVYMAFADTTLVVTVEPAPISLVMIVGHSMGAGQAGNGSGSIICEDGMAYSTHESDGTRILSNVSDVGNMGIGYGSAAKPSGINALTEAGEGVRGNDSGIAYRWNQLTGEKIWVLNAGVGGSHITGWQKGQANYTHAVTLFRKAEQILNNEIAAGHYVLKHMDIIKHSAANGSGYTVENYTPKLLAMYDDMKADLAFQFTGEAQSRTIETMGLIPIWNIYTSAGSGIYKEYPYEFNARKLVAYLLAAQRSDIYIATDVERQWLTDESTNAYFQANGLGYTRIQSGTPSLPSTRAQVFSDGVHYKQVGYNVEGVKAGESLVAIHNGGTAASLKLLDVGGQNEMPESLGMDKAETVIIVPYIRPGMRNNVAVQTTGAAVWDWATGTLSVTGTVGDTGTITFTVGGVTKTINVVISTDSTNPTPSYFYYWQFEGTLATGAGSDANSLTRRGGSYEYTEDNTVLRTTKGAYALSTGFAVDQSKNWAIETRLKLNPDGAQSGVGILLATSLNNNSNDDWAIWLQTEGSMALTKKPSGSSGYRWYKLPYSEWTANRPVGFSINDYHTYRLVNNTQTGKLEYWLDGVKIGNISTAVNTGTGSVQDVTVDQERPSENFVMSFVGDMNSGFSWYAHSDMDYLSLVEDAPLTIRFNYGEVEANGPRFFTGMAGRSIAAPKAADASGELELYGWSTTAGGEVAYEVGDSYLLASAATLYAVWGPWRAMPIIDEAYGSTVVPANGSVSPVERGGDYSFTITINEGFVKDDASFAVFANGVELTADEQGVYTIENVTEAQTITVTGVAPEYGEIVHLYTSAGSEVLGLSKTADLGTVTVNDDGTITGTTTQLKMDRAIQLPINQDWVYEITVKDQSGAWMSSDPLVFDTSKTKNIGFLILSGMNFDVVQRQSNSFNYYMVPRADYDAAITDNGLTKEDWHTYRLECKNGTVSYYLDGQKVGDLTQYRSGYSGYKQESDGGNPRQNGKPTMAVTLQYIGCVDTTYNAKFSGSVKRINIIKGSSKVQFNRNGLPTGVAMPATETTFVDKPIVLPDLDLSAQCMEFLGWTENQDGSGTLYAAGDEYQPSVIGDTVTLYAQYRSLLADFTTVYQNDGTSSNLPVSRTWTGFGSTSSVSIVDGWVVGQNAVLDYTAAVEFKLNKKWAIRFDYQQVEAASRVVFSDGDGNINNGAQETSIWVLGSGELTLIQFKNGLYWWYGTRESILPSDFDVSQPHTYQLSCNEFGVISATIDDQYTGVLDQYSTSGFKRNEFRPAVPSFDFSISHVGAKNGVTSANWSFNNAKIRNVVFYPDMNPDPATVSFAEGAGEFEPVQTVVGARIELPAVENTLEKTFIGWSETEDGDVVSSPYLVTGDVTLYPIWEVNQYTVTAAEGQHFRLVSKNGTTPTVGYNGAYSFSVVIDAGYQSAVKPFEVKANGVDIVPVTMPMVQMDGSTKNINTDIFTLSGITEDVVITVATEAVSDEATATLNQLLYKLNDQGAPTAVALSVDNRGDGYDREGNLGGFGRIEAGSDDSLVTSDIRLKMSEPVTMAYDKAWAIQATIETETSGSFVLLGDKPNVSQSSITVWIRSGDMYLVEKKANGSYYWYMTENPVQGYTEGKHTYRLEHSADGVYSYWMDGEKVGDLAYFKIGHSRLSNYGGTPKPVAGSTDENAAPFTNKNFVVQYMGAKNDVGYGDWYLNAIVSQVYLTPEAGEVSFDLNYEGAPSMESVNRTADGEYLFAGSKIILPDAPERDDSTFVGWSLNPDDDPANALRAGTEYTITQAGGVTLYAIWDDEYVTIRPEDGAHFTVNGEKVLIPVEKGTDYSFVIVIDDGYQAAASGIVVKANGEVVEPDKTTVRQLDGTDKQIDINRWTLENIQVHTVISVETIEEIPAEAIELLNALLYKVDQNGAATAVPLTVDNRNDGYDREGTLGGFGRIDVVDTESGSDLLAKDIRLKMETPVNMAKDKQWAIEAKITTTGETRTFVLLSDKPGINASHTSVWIAKNGDMYLVQKKANGFHWYMTENAVEGFTSGTHTYRLEHSADGVYSYWLDGTKIGDLTHFKVSGGRTSTLDGKPVRPFATDTVDQYAAPDDADFVVQYVGAKNDEGYGNWYLNCVISRINLMQELASVSLYENKSADDDEHVVISKNANEELLFVGSEITLPDAPADLGEEYEFLGWGTTRDGEALYQAGDTYTLPAVENDLFAIWKQLKFHVKVEDGAQFSLVYDGIAVKEITLDQENANVTFAIRLDDGYQAATNTVLIKANGEVVLNDTKEVINKATGKPMTINIDTYTLTGINEDKVISFESIEAVPEAATMLLNEILYKIDAQGQATAIPLTVDNRNDGYDFMGNLGGYGRIDATDDGKLLTKDIRLKMETAVNMAKDKQWAIEAKITTTGEASTFVLLSDTPAIHESKTSVWIAQNGDMYLVQKKANGYHWYMTENAVEGFAAGEHTYRLEHSADGVYSYWLDGTKIGDLTHFKVSGGRTSTLDGKPVRPFATDTTDQYAAPDNTNFVVQYVGAKNNEGVGNWYLNCELSRIELTPEILENYAYLVETSGSFNDNIRMNFYVSYKIGNQLLQDMPQPLTAIVTCKDVVKEIPLADCELTSKGYKISYDLVAKQVEDVVNIKLVDEGGNIFPFKNKSGSRNYTIVGKDITLRQYLDYMLTLSDWSDLGQAAMDYCYAAKHHFGYGVADSYTLSAAVGNVTLDQLERYAPGKDGSMPDGVSEDYFITAMFESDNSFRLYLTYEGDAAPEDFIYTVDTTTGNDLTEYSDTYHQYYLTFKGVYSNKLGQKHTMIITDSENTGTFTYQASVLTYARAVLLNSTDAKLKALAQALYLYNQAAIAHWSE